MNTLKEPFNTPVMEIILYIFSISIGIIILYSVVYGCFMIFIIILKGFFPKASNYLLRIKDTFSDFINTHKTLILFRNMFCYIYMLIGYIGYVAGISLILTGIILVIIIIIRAINKI